MSNEVVEPGVSQDHLPRTAVEVKARSQLIQQVMRDVMIEGTHFGKIPGAGDRMSLFKAGAEQLCVTFRIAPSFEIVDLSDGDCVRYRIVCKGSHQFTQQFLGEGLGEASSNEEKYKWRAAVCQEEFEETPEDRRRGKWKKGYDNKPPYKINQVRTESADIANTVLKMASKRAQVAMSINVTGASDIFTQDLEDLSDETRDQITEEDRSRDQTRTRATGKPRTDQPQSNASANRQGGGRCTEKQAQLLKRRVDQAGLAETEFFARYNINDYAELPFNKVDEALAYLSQLNAA